MARIEYFAIANKFVVQTDNSIRTFTKRDLLKVGFTPERGSQVFLGRLPADAYEDEIFGFVSGIGPIYQIKLILKLSGETKGFAFVTFLNAGFAAMAVATLNGKPIRPNNPIFVGISTNYRVILLKNAEGENASPQEIKKVFNRIAKTEVQEVNPSTFSIEFPEHHLAYRALKEFAVLKRDIWGQSAKLQWENSVQQNEQNNVRSRLRQNQLVSQERLDEITRELLQVQLPQRDLTAPRNQQNVLAAEARQSPDSGVSSCGGSVGAVSPTQEAAGVAPPTLVAARGANLYLPEYGTRRVAFPHNPGNIGNLVTRNGNQASAAETPRLQPVHNAAAKINVLLPKYMPTNNQSLPFENSRFASAYSTAAAGNVDKLLPRYGNQASTVASPILQSVYETAGDIGNLIAPYGNQASAAKTTSITTNNLESSAFGQSPLLQPVYAAGAQDLLPKYMPTNNQGLLFENSKFASAYSTAPAEGGIGRVASSPNPAKIKDFAPKYLPSDNQALPFENSKFASAYRQIPAERGAGRVASSPNPAKLKDFAPKYLPSDNQALPFENSRFASAYSSTSAEGGIGRVASSPNPGNVDKLLPRYGNQASTVESARVQSVHDAAAKFKDFLPKYMPSEDQALPFENSKFATAYSTASAGNSSPWKVVEDVASWALDDSEPQPSAKSGVRRKVDRLNCSCCNVHFMTPRPDPLETPVFNNHVFATNNACWMPDLKE